MAARELVPPGGRRCKLTMDGMGQLASFVDADNVSVRFSYLGNSGLIESKEDGVGRTFVYEYDDYGRMSAVVQPTGERILIVDDHSAGDPSSCSVYDQITYDPMWKCSSHNSENRRVIHKKCSYPTTTAALSVCLSVSLSLSLSLSLF